MTKGGEEGAARGAAPGGGNSRRTGDIVKGGDNCRRTGDRAKGDDNCRPTGDRVKGVEIDSGVGPGDLDRVKNDSTSLSL